MSGLSHLIPVNPPNWPDFHVCDEIFGQNLDVQQCLFVANSLITGADPVTYQVYSPDPTDTGLPWVGNRGNCWLTVEAAGPSIPGLQTIDIIPDKIRQLAFWVIQQCVNGNGGMGFGLGGYGTLGFSGPLDYVLNPMNSPIGTYPTSSTFLTVTVSGPTFRVFSPGKYDPAIPLNFAGTISQKSRSLPITDQYQSLYHMFSTYWTGRAVEMERGGNKPWWQATNSLDEMNYDCDANLGNPAVADCTQIEWNQLTPVADTLEVGPGNPTFLHHNTCYLAITSAITSITITWFAIRTALSTLLNICVHNPIQSPALGGRAYQAAEPHRITGRHITDGIHSHRKRQNGEITGLNALPSGLNITVFRQDEGWVDEATEVRSCTWNKVVKGEGVGGCSAGG